MTEAQLRLVHDALDEVVIVLGKSTTDLETMIKAKAALTEIEALVQEHLVPVSDSEYQQADVFSDGPKDF
jgi:hypothetical protein